MDLCITAQEPFEPPKPKPFTPVARASPSPHRLHPLSSPSSSSPRQQRSKPTGLLSSHLEFDLVVHDVANDSSLTHPWDMPETPLRIPLDTTKAQLLSLLRARLPDHSSTSLDTTSSNTTSSSRRRAAARHPKLAAVTLYWTFRGSILPLGLGDDSWHYRNPITKTDLLGRSELEWFLLREMMAASDGALKCYLAIRGEAPAAPRNTVVSRNTGFSWFRTSG
ncbi:hypothetical protein B0J13DRAFT_274690 [Dactylonectria estremocensis]|uniref:Uncharacterized protein n=1 Tax=Dactylonectria estremocensis TaxID=1079267 RepID=A0A9P9JB70_9HYPO|nr:hypothetical protein B0J13DRAFT_274690 [Dactylonectria estremocensis]